MFVAGIPLFLGVMAIVIDIGSFWNASIHVQLAAEAAALAGVPYMPGDFTTATTVAQAEAAKNGFKSPAATVTPAINAESNRRLDVTVSANFGTYFLRIFGMNSVRITRTATAEYTLPVPMGSPLNVYGDNTAANGLCSAAAMTHGQQPDLRRRVRHLLQPVPHAQQPVRPQRLRVRDRGPGRRGRHQHRPVRPRRSARSIANKGTGDHWIAGSHTTGVSIYYTLWSDPAATPLDYSDDVQVASTGTLFENRAAGGQVRAEPRRDGVAGVRMPDCTNDPYHDQWWTFATVTTPGTYRLQVTTTEPAQSRRPAGRQRREHVGAPRRPDQRRATGRASTGWARWSSTPTWPAASRSSTSGRSRRCTRARRWSSSCSTRAMRPARPRSRS